MQMNRTVLSRRRWSSVRRYAVSHRVKMQLETYVFICVPCNTFFFFRVHFVDCAFSSKVLTFVMFVVCYRDRLRRQRRRQTNSDSEDVLSIH